jgi:hypothetical protein
MTGGFMKRILSAILAVAIAMVSLQGCYGKMALTRKVYQVNGEVHDKYLRSLVTWVFIIVPVYGVSALADFILFNTIEFWSGKNPVASGEKNFQYTENGQRYQVNARKSGDTVCYKIDRYKGTNYLDSLSINWDTKSGNSVATLLQSGIATEYQAIRVKDSVQVLSSTQEGLKPAAELARLYN